MYYYELICGKRSIILVKAMNYQSNSKHKGSIAYARVSTREQALNSHALEQQIARLENAGAERVFFDIKSGRKDNRTGLRQVFDAIKKGEVSEVIITRIDRLGRRVPIILECVDIFQKYDVNLRVLDQAVGLGSASGRLMLNLLASFAQAEGEQIIERVKHGNNYRRNKHLACSCIPFGYTVINERYALDHKKFLCLLEERPDNYLDLYEAEIEQLPGLSPAQLGQDCIKTFLEAGNLSKAVRRIVSKYGIQSTNSKKNGNDKIFHWRPVGLKRWLTNPVLQGHTAYLKRRNLPDGRRQYLPPEEWQVVRNTHPNERLITDDQAEQINQIIHLNARNVGNGFHTQDSEGESIFREFSYLRGLVFCAECGASAITKTKYSKDGQKTYYYYACRHARKGCNNLHSTRKNQIESDLIKFFLQQAQLIKVGLDEPIAPQQPSDKLRKLETDLAKAEGLQWQSPDLERHKETLRQQIQDELNPFSQRALERKTAQEIIQAGNSLTIWNLLSADEKMMIIPRLVERITVANRKVKTIALKA